MIPEVELRLAYVWDCEVCGRENFVNGLAPELSEEDLAALRNDHGVQPWETGQFMTMPEEVTCSHCGRLFRTRHYSDSDEEE